MDTGNQSGPILEEVLSSLRQALPEILSETPVMLAYLHGSVADGTARPDSDVDIALVLDPQSGLSAYKRLLLEFDLEVKIQERGNIREADVRSIDNAPLMVQGNVLTEGILLYSRDEEFRVEYESTTRMQYFDFKPYYESIQEAQLQRLRESGENYGKTGKS